MTDYRWLRYALTSAACAASINVLGKIGMKDVNSDLATAVRSVVQATFVGVFVAGLGTWSSLGQLRDRPAAMLSILACGVAGGLSWIYGFRAIQLAQVSQVAPIDKLSMPLGVLLAVIVLGDRPTLTNWGGILLIAAAAYLATWPRPAGPGVPDGGTRRHDETTEMREK